ncbi:MAG TPA: FlgD immunoglobulin-like domain containing protein [Terriglobales bacterium]|nr:FlgD immunoglobulin-like domain containing protein [Terriglobales bacterium]
MHRRLLILAAALLAAALLLIPAPIAKAGKYAVIITGYGDDYPHINTMRFTYKTLKNVYGYQKQDIFVLWNAGQYLDLDGDGLNDNYAACTRANIFAVFDTLDLNRDVNGDDMVFVLGDDHGTQDANDQESEICTYWYGQNFEASEMDSVFTNLDEGDLITDNWPKLGAVFGQCYSGGFVDAMSRAKRTACSASTAKQVSNYYYDYNPNPRPNAQKPSVNYCAFPYHWICAMNGADPEGNPVNADANADGHVSFDEAFQYAKKNDEFAKNGSETPQYWDSFAGYGKRLMLDGTELPLVYLIHYRGGLHHGAGCWGDGGSGAPDGSGIIFGPWPGPERATSAQGTAGTRQLYARVLNSGNVPITSAQVQFSYGLPSTIAWAADTSMHYIGSAPISMLMPGDSLVVGPVGFTEPPENPFHQTYWKVFSRLDCPAIPPDSGWVDGDFGVAVENYYRATSATGGPVELRYRVDNPRPTIGKVVLQVARNTLPAGWTIQSTPALGESLVVSPYGAVSAQLRVLPDGIHGPTGTVTVEERMHDPFPGCWEHCLAATESTWVSEGGYVRTTGGISFEVTAPFSGSVTPETPELQISLARPNPTMGRVSLTYTLRSRTTVRVAIYDVNGRRVIERALGEMDLGTHAFTWDGRDARGALAPAGVYLLRLETRERVAEQRIVIVR